MEIDHNQPQSKGGFQSVHQSRPPLPRGNANKGGPLFVHTSRPHTPIAHTSVDIRGRGNMTATTNNNNNTVDDLSERLRGLDMNKYRVASSMVPVRNDTPRSGGIKLRILVDSAESVARILTLIVSEVEHISDLLTFVSCDSDTCDGESDVVINSVISFLGYCLDICTHLTAALKDRVETHSIHTSNPRHSLPEKLYYACDDLLLLWLMVVKIVSLSSSNDPRVSTSDRSLSRLAPFQSLMFKSVVNGQSYLHGLNVGLLGSDHPDTDKTNLRMATLAKLLTSGRLWTQPICLTTDSRTVTECIVQFARDFRSAPW